MLFACNSQVDKTTVAQTNTTNTENDEPIKIFRDTTRKVAKYTEESAKSVPTHFKLFKGNWIRTDLVQMIRKNKALYSNIQKIEHKSYLSFTIIPQNTFIEVIQRNQGMPDIWELTYDIQKQHYKGHYGETSMFMKFVGTELEIILFGRFTYEKYLYTKFSDELGKYYPICAITPEIISGKYDLFDKHNKLIKENIFFNEKEQTDFPLFKEYYIFPPTDGETTKNPRKNIDNQTNTEKIKAIEKYIKTSPLIDDDILFLGNRKYGSYFALKFQKDTFLLYPLNKTNEMFGRIGQQIYKKKLYYKLVPKVSKSSSKTTK